MNISAMLSDNDEEDDTMREYLGDNIEAPTTMLISNRHNSSQHISNTPPAGSIESFLKGFLVSKIESLRKEEELHDSSLDEGSNRTKSHKHKKHKHKKRSHADKTVVSDTSLTAVDNSVYANTSIIDISDKKLSKIKHHRSKKPCVDCSVTNNNDIHDAVVNENGLESINSPSFIRKDKKHHRSKKSKKKQSKEHDLLPERDNSVTVMHNIKRESKLTLSDCTTDSAVTNAAVLVIERDASHGQLHGQLDALITGADSQDKNFMQPDTLILHSRKLHKKSTHRHKSDQHTFNTEGSSAERMAKRQKLDSTKIDMEASGNDLNSKVTFENCIVTVRNAATCFAEIVANVVEGSAEKATEDKPKENVRLHKSRNHSRSSDEERQRARDPKKDSAEHQWIREPHEENAERHQIKELHKDNAECEQFREPSKENIKRKVVTESTERQRIEEPQNENNQLFLSWSDKKNISEERKQWHSSVAVSDETSREAIDPPYQRRSNVKDRLGISVEPAFDSNLKRSSSLDRDRHSKLSERRGTLLQDCEMLYEKQFNAGVSTGRERSGSRTRLEEKSVVGCHQSHEKSEHSDARYEKNRNDRTNRCRLGGKSIVEEMDMDQSNIGLKERRRKRCEEDLQHIVGSDDRLNRSKTREMSTEDALNKDGALKMSRRSMGEQCTELNRSKTGEQSMAVNDNSILKKNQQATKESAALKSRSNEKERVNKFEMGERTRRKSMDNDESGTVQKNLETTRKLTLEATSSDGGAERRSKERARGRSMENTSREDDGCRFDFDHNNRQRTRENSSDGTRNDHNAQLKVRRRSSEKILDKNKKGRKNSAGESSLYERFYQMPDYEMSRDECPKKNTLNINEKLIALSNNDIAVAEPHDEVAKINVSKTKTLDWPHSGSAVRDVYADVYDYEDGELVEDASLCSIQSVVVDKSAVVEYDEPQRSAGMRSFNSSEIPCFAKPELLQRRKRSRVSRDARNSRSPDLRTDHERLNRVESAVLESLRTFHNQYPKPLCVKDVWSGNRSVENGHVRPRRDRNMTVGRSRGSSVRDGIDEIEDDRGRSFRSGAWYEERQPYASRLTRMGESYFQPPCPRLSSPRGERPRGRFPAFTGMKEFFRGFNFKFGFEHFAREWNQYLNSAKFGEAEDGEMGVRDLTRGLSVETDYTRAGTVDPEFSRGYDTDSRYSWSSCSRSRSRSSDDWSSCETPKKKRPKTSRFKKFETDISSCEDEKVDHVERKKKYVPKSRKRSSSINNDTIKSSEDEKKKRERKIKKRKLEESKKRKSSKSSALAKAAKKAIKKNKRTQIKDRKPKFRHSKSKSRLALAVVAAAAKENGEVSENEFRPRKLVEDKDTETDILTKKTSTSTTDDSSAVLPPVNDVVNRMFKSGRFSDKIIRTYKEGIAVSRLLKTVKNKVKALNPRPTQVKNSPDLIVLPCTGMSFNEQPDDPGGFTSEQAHPSAVSSLSDYYATSAVENFNSSATQYNYSDCEKYFISPSGDEITMDTAAGNVEIYENSVRAFPVCSMGTDILFAPSYELNVCSNAVVSNDISNPAAIANIPGAKNESSKDWLFVEGVIDNNLCSDHMLCVKKIADIKLPSAGDTAANFLMSTDETSQNFAESDNDKRPFDDVYSQYYGTSFDLSANSSQNEIYNERVNVKSESGENQSTIEKSADSSGLINTKPCNVTVLCNNSLNGVCPINQGDLTASLSASTIICDNLTVTAVDFRAKELPLEEIAAASLNLETTCTSIDDSVALNLCRETCMISDLAQCGPATSKLERNYELTNLVSFDSSVNLIVEGDVDFQLNKIATFAEVLENDVCGLKEISVPLCQGNNLPYGGCQSLPFDADEKAKLDADTNTSTEVADDLCTRVEVAKQPENGKETSLVKSRFTKTFRSDSDVSENDPEKPVNTAESVQSLPESEHEASIPASEALPSNELQIVTDTAEPLLVQLKETKTVQANAENQAGSTGVDPAAILMRPPTFIPPKRLTARKPMIGVKISDTSAAFISSGAKVEDKQPEVNLEDGELEDCSSDDSDGSDTPPENVTTAGECAPDDKTGSLSESDDGEKKKDDNKSRKKKLSKKKLKKAKKKKKNVQSKRRRHDSPSDTESIASSVESFDERGRSRSRSFSVTRTFDEKKGVWREKKKRRPKPSQLHLQQRDKSALRVLALKRAFLNMQNGLGPNVKIRATERSAFLDGPGKKSVGDFTDFCQMLSASAQYESSDSDNEDDRPRRPPGDQDEAMEHLLPNPLLRPKDSNIVMNIRNLKQLPTMTTQDKIMRTAALRLQFPVSSGSQHHIKESVWTPVDHKPPPIPAAHGGNGRKDSDMRCPIASAASTARDIAVNSTPEMDISASFVGQSIDIGQLVTARLNALRKLQRDPTDINAVEAVYSAQLKMKQWAETRQVPGDFFYSVARMGLMGNKLKRHDWLRKADAEKNASIAAMAAVTVHTDLQMEGGGAETPVLLQTPGEPGSSEGSSTQQANAGVQAGAETTSITPPGQMTKYDIGKMLLQRMGWHEGLGLGRNNLGPTEPLKLDMKMDRKGLRTLADDPRPQLLASLKPGQRMPNPNPHLAYVKHPCNVLVDVCIRRHWQMPQYTLVDESGPDHRKIFLIKVLVNGVEYQPIMGSGNKKAAKLEAAAVCLQELGVTIL